MKTLPYGHPSTLREGPFPCKGDHADAQPHTRQLNAEQIAWMKQHKPLYFTGILMHDLPHLPKHLRTI